MSFEMILMILFFLSRSNPNSAAVRAFWKTNVNLTFCPFLIRGKAR
jgi:hypothetical protein